MSIDNKGRFSIESFNKLYKDFVSQMDNLTRSKFKTTIINHEYSKIKMCRFNLDRNYYVKCFVSNDKIYIQHYYDISLFDIDIYDVNTGKLITTYDMIVTFGNIFNAITGLLMSGKIQINSDTVSILANTIDNCRFERDQFEYLANHLTEYKHMLLKIKSRLLLDEMQYAG